MKGLQPSTPVIVNQGRIRLVLVIAGVVIAFLCLLALAADFRSAELLKANVSHPIESSTKMLSDLVGQTMTWL